MSLVKTTALKNGNHGSNGQTRFVPTPGTLGAMNDGPRDADGIRRRAKTLARQQQAAERLASASGELSHGVQQASTATQEMRAAMTQIAEGAETNARAAQETLAASSQIAQAFQRQSELAAASLQTTANLAGNLEELSSGIGRMVTNVSAASQRQSGSVEMIRQLEQRANDIGEIVKAVARIADQTNLLALNAAIEAARAGEYGTGFAVVADEVRTLAETSEKSARDIEALVQEIQTDVARIAQGISESAAAARGEVEKCTAVTAQLDGIRADMTAIADGAQQIAEAAKEAVAAAREAQSGAQSIAAAGEEQAAACEEANKMIEQQRTALMQSETAARELADLSDDLKNSTDVQKSAETVASASEELSEAVQEISRAAESVLTALDQISRGAQQQAGATRQAASAAGQIEKTAQRGGGYARQAVDAGIRLRGLLGENKSAVEDVINGLGAALEASRRSQGEINALEQVSRRIDKIVESIAKVSIQTNMLAVNGSIEAARAGEYGKGFAVVSTDIRNLAQESSTNADRIKDLVKAIQDQIASVRRDLDQIGAAALSEVETARVTTAGLVTVAESIGAVVDSNREILRSSEEVQVRVQESRKAIESVASAAEQTQRASSESASAAREQSQGARELARAIEEIASLADELQSVS